ncbi:RidA family protein [Notoacmeibacter sp. MSK16QG-6]|uniref:RidA family protein n=1 Tax=Notoacmeibacter sp. MSK16QG-6 TaxID=2957982 RepID=UPI00209F36A5|nr:RidA family protein [Notoacmeibacter sp. MSK16QG-6]MCP1200405.1 RidA family protein [Notoacmeibacter sp. MSK16QG-6]
MKRQLISSGSYLEPEIGFSRAVRVGNVISVAGTAPIKAGGGNAAPGDAYGQMKRCIEIARTAIEEAGGSLRDATRTRILVTDIAHWKDAARAHGEAFHDIRPVTTVMQVTAFVDPEWLVEIEVDCVISDNGA